MDVQERARAVIEPLLDPLGVEVFDVDLVGTGKARVLRLSIDRDGGVDLDLIAEVSHIVSRALDDADPLEGAYTLEVSSPGVERPLRLPAHFRRVIGETVAIKTHQDVDGERRHQGVLRNVDDDGVTLEVGDASRRLSFEQMAKARTVFEWGPAPKPGAKTPQQSKKTKV